LLAELIKRDSKWGLYWYDCLDILYINSITMLVNNVPKSDVDKVVKGDVDGDVIVLSMLLETQFLVNLIVVTAFWGFSCDEM
jgi:hypothetical protein